MYCSTPSGVLRLPGHDQAESHGKLLLVSLAYAHLKQQCETALLSIYIPRLLVAFLVHLNIYDNER